MPNVDKNYTNKIVRYNRTQWEAQVECLWLETELVKQL